ncbi:SDR family oxidoreductase [Vineibacter terrae]|uniref:SDR family oxidoreductase n=2 Tax=Vineibacter terrae TaxID=2586908 RepID=A0A5C8PCC3_9HYPH|nr:SDR family oxidoreductase [Vineibacter terrae]
MGKVGDIAAACLYLASDAGSFVTGQTLHVNGGQFMF